MVSTSTYLFYIHQWDGFLYQLFLSIDILQLLDSTVYENVQGNCDNDDATCRIMTMVITDDSGWLNFQGSILYVL